MPHGRRLKVACFTHHLSKYKVIASAMCAGIRACGDEAEIFQIDGEQPDADVAVSYGWKRNRVLHRYPQFAYADLGYWCRATHFRLAVNGWSPDSYVLAGLSAHRLASFGVQVQPWRGGGREVLLVGASAKSMCEHGYSYLEWETAMARALVSRGLRVAFRPKPTDLDRMPIQVEGVTYDERPLLEALNAASCVVTHHSNVAIDALVHGVPAYCELGAGAAFSVQSNEISAAPPRLEGREQFLADVAWLQWSLDEMRSGAAWAHLRERNLIR
jgi:hypothetical protein